VYEGATARAASEGRTISQVLRGFLEQYAGPRSRRAALAYPSPVERREPDDIGVTSPEDLFADMPPIEPRR
jgi:hypothetical protein